MIFIVVREENNYDSHNDMIDHNIEGVFDTEEKAHNLLKVAGRMRGIKYDGEGVVSFQKEVEYAYINVTYYIEKHEVE